MGCPACVSGGEGGSKGSGGIRKSLHSMLDTWSIRTMLLCSLFELDSEEGFNYAKFG
jgi:hypothetical protein